MLSSSRGLMGNVTAIRCSSAIVFLCSRFIRRERLTLRSLDATVYSWPLPRQGAYP